MAAVQQIALAFIGAGNVNFGGGEGPWDHASRFEKIHGVTFAGVADVDLARAQSAVTARQAGQARKAWGNTRAFGDWREMIDVVKPNAVVIGVPPDMHGQSEGPNDMELFLARRGIAMLVEKPLGVADPNEVQKVADKLARLPVIVSVGYMFRYSQAVTKMRELLDESPGGPRVFLARYDCAYSEIRKPAWWDIRRSGGPIVEQATHFLDLARYLCGDVDPGTIRASRISATDPAGMLTDIPVGNDGASVDAGIHHEDRAPRATLAQWRFESGALGALAHAVLLHGRQYEAELEVWADGLRCVLADPYGQCRLGVRQSGSDQTRWLDFANDDPYLAEDKAFIDAIRAGSPAGVRSRYTDALETYRLSWLITHAAK